MIYEINTAVWLGELSRAAGRPVTLGEVTGRDWDAVSLAGVDRDGDELADPGLFVALAPWQFHLLSVEEGI